MKELTELFEARRRAPGVPHAVATVLRVEGSSYRRPGARMLIDVHGRIAGSVSGGCLERKVISEGQAALLDLKARWLAFDTTDQDDLAFGSSLGCFGKIGIGIEILPSGQPWLLETVVEEIRAQRRPAILVTQTHVDRKQVYFESKAFFPGTSGGDKSPIPEIWREEIDEVLRLRKSRFMGGEMAGSVFIEWLAPPLALILLGGGPDVPPLVSLAAKLGHDVTVIDRRPDFAVPGMFPGAKRVMAAKPYQIASLLRPDDRTVAVVMNHHYDTDRDVIAAMLPLGLPYLGVLGPRRRTERILAELKERGLTPSQATRAALHAPAGLDLGGENPEEIALAILAEIQATLTGREGGKLKFRDAPIHVPAINPSKEACSVPG